MAGSQRRRPAAASTRAMHRPISAAAASTPASRASLAASVATPAARPLSPESRMRREHDLSPDQDTGINIVVRCRERSTREKEAQSGPVVHTTGVMGDTIELTEVHEQTSVVGMDKLKHTRAKEPKKSTMYKFNKVFSPAADQQMIFDEVVAPILDDVLNGVNSTIFAYGQTGTGKTFTMSGDLTDAVPLPPHAGIIPRLLHAMFAKLNGEGNESAVKCSFIELYQKEIMDLLEAGENDRRHLTDAKRLTGHSGAIVKDMKEIPVSTASKGIELLRKGSLKRQVAETNCNHMSSRSHTVFTIAIFVKKPSKSGEDMVQSGKLNLVDLAGSEDIKSSGAEEKRAVEAGQINKDLAFLGRVIDALAHKKKHIPYRDCDLTRLLQDSLGGHTKTCIIATISPALSSFKETYSTLSFIKLAQNIQNRPQINGMIQKSTLFQQFTEEIASLHTILDATTRKSGIYVPHDMYEDMTGQIESQKSEVLELKEKVKALEQRGVERQKELQQQTEESTSLKDANRKLEQDLAGLRDVNEKRERQRCSSQSKVRRATSLIDRRLAEFRSEHETQMSALTHKITTSLHNVSNGLAASLNSLRESIPTIEQAQEKLREQTSQANTDKVEVLEQIKPILTELRRSVSTSLADVSDTAKTHTMELLSNIDSFYTQLDSSCSSLDETITKAFGDLITQVQQQELDLVTFRQQLLQRGCEADRTHQALRINYSEDIQQGKKRFAALIDAFKQRFGAMLEELNTAQTQIQDERESRVANTLENSHGAFRRGTALCTESIDKWSSNASGLLRRIVESRDNVDAQLKHGFSDVKSHAEALRQNTTLVGQSTSEYIGAHMKNTDTQLCSLDDAVLTLQQLNENHHAHQTELISTVTSTVHDVHTSIKGHIDDSLPRMGNAKVDLEDYGARVQSMLSCMDKRGEIPGLLEEIRNDIGQQDQQEHAPTDQTPPLIKRTSPAMTLCLKSGGPMQLKYPPTITYRAVNTSRKSPIKRIGSTVMPVSSPLKYQQRVADASDDSSGGREGLRDLDPNTFGPSSATGAADSEPATTADTPASDSPPSPSLPQQKHTLKRPHSDPPGSPLPLSKRPRNTKAIPRRVDGTVAFQAHRNSHRGVGVGGTQKRLRSHGTANI